MGSVEGHAQDQQIEQYLIATDPDELVVIESYQASGYAEPDVETRYHVGYYRASSMSMSVSGRCFGFRDLSQPRAPVMHLWVCHIKSISTCI